MVGSVNRVAAIEGPQRLAAHKPASPEVAADAHGTAQEGGADAEPDEGAPLAPPDRLGYAKLSQISTVLTTLASARTSQRDLAAFALQRAERKLRRLKAEALAVFSSGDGKAAARIAQYLAQDLAQDLAEVAREIADAARDYAAAAGEPGLMEAGLADLAAGIDGGAAPEQDAIASEPPQAASSAPAGEPVMAALSEAADDPGTASSHPTIDDADPSRALPEDDPYPGALLRHEADDHGDESIEAHAHALLEEAAELKRAMERILRGPPARAEAPPAAPKDQAVEIGPDLQTGLTTLVARPRARDRDRARV